MRNTERLWMLSPLSHRGKDNVSSLTTKSTALTCFILTQSYLAQQRKSDYLKTGGTMRSKELFLLSTLLLLSMAVSAFAQEECDGVYGNGPHKFSLATGSPGEFGILKVLG